MSFRLPEYDTLASLANGENPDSVEGDGQGAFKGSVKRIEVGNAPNRIWIVGRP